MLPGKSPGVLLHRKSRGASSLLINLQNGTPLGETGAGLIVLGASLRQPVKTSGGGLTMSSREFNDTGINLDKDKNIKIHMSKKNSN